MQGLGYKELVPHIRKERTLERSVALLKQETRHFAKRQMTWFKADPRIKWIDVASSGTREGTINELVRGCLDALGNS
jgi:tRNA dimethylallyltransferase